MDALADEEGQLVGILARGRNTDDTWPVVIDVAQLVGEPLYVVWLQAAVVVDDVVVRGGDAAASHRLAHNKKIIPFRAGHLHVDHCSRKRILKSPSRLSKKSGVHAFLHHDHC